MNILQIISDLDKKGRYSWMELTSKTYGNVKVSKSQGVFYCIERNGYEPLIVTVANIPIDTEHSFVVTKESKGVIKDERKRTVDSFYFAAE